MVTKDELYEEAKSLDIEGRSEMDKEELEVAVAEAKAKGVSPKAKATSSDAVETGWTRGDGTPAPAPRDHRAVESGWSRGADLEDAAAVAAADEESRLANMGSTGSTAQYEGGQAVTGGAEAGSVQDLADERAEIRGAAVAREAEKVEQTEEAATVPAAATDQSKAGTGEADEK